MRGWLIFGIALLAMAGIAGTATAQPCEPHCLLTDTTPSADHFSSWAAVPFGLAAAALLIRRCRPTEP